MAQFQLEPKLIEQTVAQLRHRIEERFPAAGLGKVCAALQAVAAQSERHATWLGQPVVWLRGIAFVLIAAMIAAPFGLWMVVDWKAGIDKWPDFVQGLEALINEVVLFSAGIYFMYSLEGRYKRHRGMRLLQELRSLAHVVDMHQLTKDPERITGKVYQSTPSSPAAVMDGFLLRRYLDYCSEMLSLIGKVAASYIRDFEDTEMVGAVNEIETLTGDLTRKVWQKIMVLHSVLDDAPCEPGRPAPPATGQV